jgi:hypothetical protein
MSSLSFAREPPRMNRSDLRPFGAAALVLLAAAPALADGPAGTRLQLKDVLHLEYASDPQVSPDGEHVVVSFGSEGLYCYNRKGKLLWEMSLGVLDSGWFYDASYQRGYGSSPVLHQGLVIVQCDVGKGSFIAALKVADGKEVWRKSREEIPSWGTPTVVAGPARAELVTAATKFARGYDPLTGEELWRLGPHAEITVPTPFYGAGLIFITCGYRPVQPIYAVRPGASGDVTPAEGKTANGAVAWSTEKGGRTCRLRSSTATTSTPVPTRGS